MKRLAAVLTAVTLALGVAVLGAPGASAQALPMGRCTTSANVVVAVDFGHWGGPIVRGCGSTPTRGLTLLNQGGFSAAGTQHDGPGFVCRIGSASYAGGTQYPTPDADACVKTPPDTAYWSYWHADAGQTSWSYSSLGAASYSSKPGSVEYWQFGATDRSGTEGRPTVSPAELRATNTTPTGGTQGGGSGRGGGDTGGGGNRAGGNGGGGTGGGGRGDSGGDTGGSRDGGSEGGRGGAAGRSTGAGGSSGSSAAQPGSRTSATGRPAPSSSGSGSVDASGAPSGGSSSAPPSVATSGPAIIDATPTSGQARKQDSGSALPLVFVLVVVVALGAGAGITVLRRRRLSE